jgi:hypothetical protein
MERQKAAAAMLNFLVNYYQCNEDDIDLGSLEVGTTWQAGQDFQASYRVNFSGLDFLGQIYWSTTSQEVYI